MPRFVRWIAALLVSVLALPVQAQDSVTDSAATAAAPTAEAPDLVSVLDADGRFTVLVGALQSTNLVETLQGEGPFTVFAPTDEAFAALPEGALDVLTPEQLQAVLLYHVVGGAVDGETAAGAGEAQSVGGQLLQFSVVEDGLRVNDALVVEGDVAASNGVIHVISAVLMPPPADTSDESPGDGSDAESGPDRGP